MCRRHVRDARLHGFHAHRDRPRALRARCLPGRVGAGVRRRAGVLDRGGHFHAPHGPRCSSGRCSLLRAAGPTRTGSALLDGAPRSAAAETAPPHGLYLESVKYPPEPVDDPRNRGPVLAPACVDQVLKHTRLDREQRLRARADPTHECVVDQVVDRHVDLLAQPLEGRTRVLELRGSDGLAEGAVVDQWTLNRKRLWLCLARREPRTGFSRLPTESIARGTTA